MTENPTTKLEIVAKLTFVAPLALVLSLLTRDKKTRDSDLAVLKKLTLDGMNRLRSDKTPLI